MSVVLAFNERAKSYNIFREGLETKLALTLKNIEDDSEHPISASVSKIPDNYEYTFRSISSFQTALGFLKHGAEVFLIVVEKSLLISQISGINIFKIISVKAFELSNKAQHKQNNVDLELQELLLYLSSGFFYYSDNSNITLNSQSRESANVDVSYERYDIFCWNQHLLQPVQDLASQVPFEHAKFLNDSIIFSKISKGFFGKTTKAISAKNYEIGVYTRIGKKKAGTRFNSRGLDDEGNVSIFGETEIIVYSDEFLFSYNLLRGSVPVFWVQQGFQIGTPKIRISRAPLATQPSFDRHFESITQNYGLVHIVNLLSSKEGSVELLLTDAYEYHVNNSIHSEDLSFTSFDLNKVLQTNEKEGLELLFQRISRDILVFGFNLSCSESPNKRLQKGVFRVNCLDCLDRTNVAQDFISRKVIDLFFRNNLLGQNFKQIDSIRIQSAVSRLFSDNGDAISLIYAGTGALKTSITRKGQSGVFDYLNDFSKSAYRIYCGNFTDKAKQDTLDNILGNSTDSSEVEFFNPISKIVQTQLKTKYSMLFSSIFIL
jgi:synaptojanin